MTRVTTAGAALCAIAMLCGCGEGARTVSLTADADAGPMVMATSPVDAGRYLVLVGGCNDCHTPRYAMTNGAEPPEAEWLKGSAEPHTGPWGTSYGKNLRLTVAGMTEDQWVERLNTGTSLPPMPWPSVRALSDADKRAVYAYIKSLPGDPGVPSPAPLPPAAPAG